MKTLSAAYKNGCGVLVVLVVVTTGGPAEGTGVVTGPQGAANWWTGDGTSGGAEAGNVPVPVSPGSGHAESVAASPCPTFNWGGLVGARAYELVVYRVEGVEAFSAEPVVHARVPVAATGWTPSLEQCLEAGESYAWAVRAISEEDPGPWSEASLFRVADAPSWAEVEEALDMLRRYQVRIEGADPQRSARRPDFHETDFTTWPINRDQMLSPAMRPRQRYSDSEHSQPRVGETVVLSAPTLGAPSLKVSNQIHLGGASDIFKGGAPFLWSDFSNLGLGEYALASNFGERNTALGHYAMPFNDSGNFNTAVGSRALFVNSSGSYNTAVGGSSMFFNSVGTDNVAVGTGALFGNTSGDANTAVGVSALGFSYAGSSNTAVGRSALRANSLGSGNTAVGREALDSNGSGVSNVAVGFKALRNNTSGLRNVAVGPDAGANATTGSDNIFLGAGSEGVAGEANTIRIGGTTGTGAGQQNRTFIAGIRGVTTGIANAMTVFIDGAGQLGTASSSRESKQDIEEVGARSARLLDLRPVAFRYRQHAAAPDVPLEFGLIAEEVAEVFPELVVWDAEGRPESVRYHLLSALLLNELQAERKQLEALNARHADMEARLQTLEANESPPVIERRRWSWRRP